MLTNRKLFFTREAVNKEQAEKENEDTEVCHTTITNQSLSELAVALQQYAPSLQDSRVKTTGLMARRVIGFEIPLPIFCGRFLQLNFTKRKSELLLSLKRYTCHVYHHLKLIIDLYL